MSTHLTDAETPKKIAFLREDGMTKKDIGKTVEGQTAYSCFLLMIIALRLLIDFLLLHIVNAKWYTFVAIGRKIDSKVEPLFGQRRTFTLFAPDGSKIVTHGYREAKYLAFLIFDIYLRKPYERGLGKLETPKSVIVDVGAHMGVFTLKAARKVLGRGIVVAVEPYPYNFERLLKNIRVNQLANVIPLDIALGEKEAVTPLWLPPFNEENTGIASTEFKISNNFILVPVRTLADVMTELGIKSVDLLKLDAEGAELSILKGLNENLRSVKNIAIAAEHSPEELKQICQFLRARGFRMRVDFIGGAGFAYAENSRERNS